jgi:glycosyltransferase involved in cell wall biosynthesis
MKVILYHSSIIAIGGIETFMFNFIKRMHDKIDLTLYFDVADEQQLFKYSKYVNCYKNIDQKIKCDVLILASAWGKPITQNVQSNMIVQMIHANLEIYKQKNLFTFIPDKRVTHYVCVSNDVAKALYKIHRIKSTVIYNLLDQIKPIKKPKNKLLTFITASRISPEKGIERCIQLAKQIPYDYVWYMYGDTPYKEYLEKVKKQSTGTNIKWMGFKTPIRNEIAKADYLVQLSDTEGFCYSIIEALQMHTPCIITPFPSGKEQIENKKNGYVIDFELKNINFEEIKNNIPIITTFKEFSTEQDWLNLFKDGKNKENQSKSIAGVQGQNNKRTTPNKRGNIRSNSKAI